MSDRALDPELDLLLERDVDVPPELVWSAWTQPEHVRKWFAPRPAEVVECDIDLRPGGIFRTVMRVPGGEQFENVGTYLEIVDRQRLVWTMVLRPGFRPAPPPDLPFTAVISLAPIDGRGTRYSALAMHGRPEVRARHATLGFSEGWSTALDQLVEVAGELARSGSSSSSRPNGADR
jgi:uncharacterized protein YndB with AHSA1/START domain